MFVFHDVIRWLSASSRNQQVGKKILLQEFLLIRGGFDCYRLSYYLPNFFGYIAG